MRSIMVMFDSLNRHYLPNYSCDLARMPNFQRLGERCVTFDNSYVGSLPCMPARRELHTGRLNFLHRGWCPLEPFDDSMPELLRQNGVYSHIVSDHQHYWEDGGATYHTRYSSWENVRGQEGDPWKGDLRPIGETTAFGGPPPVPYLQNIRRQDAVNRSYMTDEADFPQARTFAKGLAFMEVNREYDNWFLQIETFDPHEPFFTPDEYQALYRGEGEEIFPFDWPPYGPVTEDEDFIGKVRKKYFALLSMCDQYMGKVLDKMDELELWKDTMLIVNTDHGYLLGEHLWWAKTVMPTYNELAHTPLFIWDPRCGKRNERRSALVQTIDLAPTLLDYFGLPIPRDMQGVPLGETIRADKPVRDYALFGFFGSHVNITDGRWLYMRAPAERANAPLFEYTLMPTQMRSRMSPEELGELELAPPFSFTKGVRTLKIPSSVNHNHRLSHYRYGNKLYDLSRDPEQLAPVDNPEKEIELIREMAKLMRENNAPTEQFERIGIPVDGVMTKAALLRQRDACAEALPDCLPAYEWDPEGRRLFDALAVVVSSDDLPEQLEAFLSDKRRTIDKDVIRAFSRTLVPEEDLENALYTIEMISRAD